PEDSAGRPGLSDDRDARPAPDRDRCLAGRPVPSGTGQLRVPDAVRRATEGTVAASPRRRTGSGLRAVRSSVVRLPAANVGRTAGQPRVVPAIDGEHDMTVAVLGGGVMGEALLSGLVRAGQAVSE